MDEARITDPGPAQTQRVESADPCEVEQTRVAYGGVVEIEILQTRKLRDRRQP